MKSKRFLNNSVHQKTSAMHISLPLHKITGNSNQGGAGTAAAVS